MRRHLWVLAVVGSAALGAAASAEPRSTLELTAQVPAEQDGCLDHAVKELGMSAKRQAPERVWAIGPQFLHPSLVPDGSVRLELRRDGARSTIRIAVSWAGPLKPPPVEADVEERASLMASKMAQVCGVIAAEVRCLRAPAGGAPAACR